jgi:hypothetical protein
MRRSTDPALDYRGIRHPQSYNEPLYSPQGQDDTPVDDVSEGAHALDGEPHLTLLRKLEDWWFQARTVQAPQRYEMAIDDDFYDGLQWAEEDKQEVEGRGQPALVFNVLRESINWIIGTERRSRIDFAVHPREDSDRQGAEQKTHLLKYIDDVNKGGFARSRAFSDASRVGLGWLEDGIRSDPFDEPLYSRAESWRNIWYDHLAIEPDLSDARYIFRAKWLDVDVACAMWPDRADRIKAAAHAYDLYGASDDDEFFTTALYYQTDSSGRPVQRRTYIDDALGVSGLRRPRVRVVEAWYRVPKKGKFLYVEDREYVNFHRAAYDDRDPQMKELVDNGYAAAYDAIRMQMEMTIFVDGALLQKPQAPYRHDKSPFTPIWAYRRKRDGAPYGPIRNMRDPQDDLNKRRSKSLYILSTNQVFMERGAVANKDELREEVADPAGIIEYEVNKKFDVRRDNTLAAQHVDLAKQDEEYIRMAGGVTSENLGHQSNATSGRAIVARQEQGSVVTAELFDNLRYAIQCQGEKRLALIEQFYDRPKVIRITGDRGQDDFLELNKPVMGQDGAVTVENPITASQADFIVDEQDFRETIRLAMFEQLYEMVNKLPPEISLQLLDLVVDMSDVHGKDELVRRIRKINGQTAPDAEQTPEGQAEAEAKKRAEEMMARIEQRGILAKLEEQIGKAKQAKAESLVRQLEALRSATELAFQMAQNPTMAPLVEAVIGAAKDGLNEDDGADGATNAAPPPPEAPQPQPQQTLPPQPM